MSNILRTIPFRELRKSSYAEMVDLAKIFNHEIVETDGERRTWRWKENSLIRKITGGDGGIQFHTPPEWQGSRINQIYDGAVDLNGLAIALHNKKFTLEEYMKFYMQMGYSSCGFSEIFGSKEITEYGIEYLTQPPDDWDFGNKYWQTPIEYMSIKYKGQILKI